MFSHSTLHTDTRTLTSTVRSGEIHCPSDIARHALGAAVHGTLRTGCRHAMIAYTHIPCDTHTHTVHYCLRVHVGSRLRTIALGSLVVDGPSCVAEGAFCGTVHRTSRAVCRHAILAFANICCSINTHTCKIRGCPDRFAFAW